MSPPQQVAWPLLARMTDFLASYYTYLPLPLSNRSYINLMSRRRQLTMRNGIADSLIFRAMTGVC